MLIALLIAVIVLGAIGYLLSLLPMAEPFKTAVTVIYVVVAILILLTFLPGAPYHRVWGY